MDGFPIQKIRTDFVLNYWRNKSKNGKNGK